MSDAQSLPTSPAAGFAAGPSLWISLPLLLIALLAAPLIGWKYRTAASAAGTTTPVAEAPRRPMTDGVAKLSAERWRVTAGPAALVVRKGGLTGAIDCELYFERYEFLTAKQIDLLGKVRRLVNDRHLAEYLAITPEQMRAMREIRARAEVKVDAADVQRIQSLFPTYERIEAPARLAAGALHEAEVAMKQPANLHDPSVAERVQRARREWERLEADRRQAETPLIQAMEDAADHVFPFVKQSAVQRAKEANDLFTPEQKQKMAKLNNR